MRAKLFYFIKLLKYLNFKTIYFNFKYFKFREAVKMPILLSNNVYLKKIKGEIRLEGTVSSAKVIIGGGGVDIFDEKKSRTIWSVEGIVIFKGRALIGHGSKICVQKEGILTLGDNFNITAESSVVAYKSVTFGSDCLLSWNVLIMDADSHYIRDEHNNILNDPEAVTIGNHVWIGCRTLILKGTVVPDGAVIGANSLVNKKQTIENSIYAGNPVKMLKANIRWDL